MNIDKWDEYGLECDQHLYPELGRIRDIPNNRLNVLKGWPLPINRPLISISTLTLTQERNKTIKISIGGLTLAAKVTNLLSALYSLKMAERSEAKSVKQTKITIKRGFWREGYNRSISKSETRLECFLRKNC